MTGSSSTNDGKLDLMALGRRLRGLHGRRFWRALEELAETQPFLNFLIEKFPAACGEWGDPLNRRRFLMLMGASLAMAGLSGCTQQPKEAIVPYINQPDALTPGQPLFYNTAMTLDGYGYGVTVTSAMGRPIKVDGNADHPASLGHSDVFGQAALLSIYDPDRSQAVRHNGRISSWDSFLYEMAQEMARHRQSGGAGVRLLSGTVTSPTLAAQIQAFLNQYPAAVWHRYEPLARDNIHAGARLAFGVDVEPVCHFDRAMAILALDADFLSWGPGHLRYTSDFADARRVRAGKTRMNRLYVIEGTPTITGAMADHRLAARPSLIEGLATALARQLGVNAEAAAPAGLSADQIEWVEAVARDLRAQAGASLVIAGDQQPPAVQALTHAMNEALGSVGRTVDYIAPVEPHPVDQSQSLGELTRAMAAGKVDTLIILGGNPLYQAPADLAFPTYFEKVRLRIHLSPQEDETSVQCHWHLPESHFLEAWGDARAFDGTATIQQPLIEPIFSTRSAIEVLAAIMEQPDQEGRKIVRATWQKRWPAQDFERRWLESLAKGVVAGTASPPQAVRVRAGLAADLATRAARKAAEEARVQKTESGNAGELEVIFRPDPCLWDGRFANNAWLQELPKPLTKLTWDNAALMSAAMARRFNLADADKVRLSYRQRQVTAPVLIMPGHADDCITLYLGGGRTHAGNVAREVGFNAYALRTAEAPWFGPGIEVRKTGEKWALATDRAHHSMEGRGLVQSATIEQFRANPDFVREGEQRPLSPPTIYPPWPYTGYVWGMVIDLNVCIGCNACVAACQAENNIPVVGKEQVMRGRAMHWIRVDRYEEESEKNPRTQFQPVPCMHCEQAPCELVCPVGATVHSNEGLNEMVYNRCVGTRYCSNNCPYKVRRFNFFKYNDTTTPILKMLRNPEVTVRSRGVMEKCTYCVQRIVGARIRAEEENRTIREGEVRTACQAACPTGAIIFGDLNDKRSLVALAQAQPHNYGLLEELNTRPRTTYLARIRNPNPELEAS